MSRADICGCASVLRIHITSPLRVRAATARAGIQANDLGPNPKACGCAWVVGDWARNLRANAQNGRDRNRSQKGPGDSFVYDVAVTWY